MDTPPESNTGFIIVENAEDGKAVFSFFGRFLFGGKKSRGIIALN
jgi:hypothetical protein